MFYNHPLLLSKMNSGPSAGTRSTAKRGCSNVSETKSKTKRSKSGPSLSKLPDEILQLILEYVSVFDGSVGLRLVCRRFEAILSSLLLSSISAFASDGDHNIEFRMKGFRKLVVTENQANTPLCPVESHIRHVSVQLTHSESYGDFDEPRVMEDYKHLLVRIVKRVKNLKSVKLVYNLNKLDIQYSDLPPIELVAFQAGMDTLIASVLSCIPAHINIEVELVMIALELDGRSVSLRPAHWSDWRDYAIQFGHTTSREIVEEWPKSIDEVWSVVDSLDISACITANGGQLFSEPGIGELADECISHRHIFQLYDYMIPGAFLALQFPKGFLCI